MYDDMDRICGNCKHWQASKTIALPTPKGYKPCAPCGKQAVTCEDAGVCCVMLSEDGNCKLFDDVFEPTKEAIDEYNREQEDWEDYQKTREEAWRTWKAS